MIDKKYIGNILKTKGERLSFKSFSVSVEDVKETEKGLQVFIKAFDKKNKAIGFGKDGTVETERLNIVNPPSLVEDENGNIIVKSIHPRLGVVDEVRYRHDPKEALAQAIEDTVNVIGKKGKKVIKGKIGKTTTTVYSNAGGDGGIYAGGDTWANIRSATSGTNEAGETTGACYSEGSTSTNVWLERVFLPFDTSGLPDTDEISSAVLSLRGTAKWDQDNDAKAYVGIVASTQASATSLADGDFDAIGGTLLSDTIDITSWITNNFNAFTLNASGIGAISTTGYSLFALREGHDIENEVPGNGLISGVTARMANYTGTTSDPKLVIEHAEASGNTQLINIGDTFKTVEAMQINIGDEWKPVVSAKINIGDDWKTIF